MIEYGIVQVNDQDRKDHTLLHYAVVNKNNAKMTRFLLQKSAYVNAKDCYGDTIISARQSSLANQGNFAANQKVELLLHAATNKKPLPKVIDKMRKALEVFGIMNCNNLFEC
jgi:ankyrin repeat protein